MTTLTSVPPLFIKDCDIGDPGITPYLMCNAVTKATSTSKLEGIVVCGESGHKLGDLGCKALPTETIRAFKGFRHPLSNHFPCRLQVYESEFKSVEHAYFWQMATEFGNSDLATEIKNSAHAGEIKKLSKLIAEDDKRFTWETDNIDVMKFLLQAKAKQCTQFRNCLIENKGKTLAETTPSKLWASGLSPFVTEHSSPVLDRAKHAWSAFDGAY